MSTRRHGGHAREIHGCGLTGLRLIDLMARSFLLRCTARTSLVRGRLLAHQSQRMIAWL
jgi:hypothetical protein